MRSRERVLYIKKYVLPLHADCTDLNVALLPCFDRKQSGKNLMSFYFF
jgi:hypothetical protein